VFTFSNLEGAILNTKVKRTCVNTGTIVKLYYCCLTTEFSDVLRVNGEHIRDSRASTEIKAIISGSFPTPTR